MKFYNVIDEQGRFFDLKVYSDDTGDGQFNSHARSYLTSRREYENMYGQDLGLGKEER